MKVRINIIGGQAPIEFEVQGHDVRQFWRKLSELPRTKDMVPLSADSSYGGLTVRSPDRPQDVRVFGGVVSNGDQARRDELRELERWLLAKAPPPLGPSLLARLDEDVAAHVRKTGTAPPGKAPTAQALLLSCRTRAKGKDEIRVRCLQEGLKDALSAKEYAAALEGVATAKLAP